MTTTLKDKIAQLDPDHRAEIEGEAERLRAEYLRLTEPCEARER